MCHVKANNNNLNNHLETQFSMFGFADPGVILTAVKNIINVKNMKTYILGIIACYI